MSKFGLSTIEKFVIRDKHCISSLLSLAAVLLIALNLSYFSSFPLGILASLLYFSINILFLGHSLFSKEKLFSRVLLGSMLFFLILGFVSWVTMILYNLDIVRCIVALAFVAVLSSFLNRRKAKRIEPVQKLTESETQSEVIEQSLGWRSYLPRLLFVFMLCLSTYLLLISRGEEVYTVWQFLHPLFLPMYLVSTIILVVSILSSEKAHIKLVSVIAHSILTHILFVVVFPAGDVGVQQQVLATTRRIYENLTLFGYGHSPNVFVQIYYWLNGINFQSAYSVIFARMFSVDVLWSHLAFIPISWSIFVPLVTFMIAKTLNANDTISSLSSLLVLVFPATIYWGAFSVPNSLGFIFALSSIYFVLKYVTSDDSYSRFPMLVFSFASFISHYLTGMIALAVLILGITVRIYRSERKTSLMSSRYLILTSLIFCTSLLPLSLVYHRFLSSLYAEFSLYLWRSLPPGELVGMFVFGEYLGYGPLTLVVYISGPLLGLIGTIYMLRSSKNNRVGNNGSLGPFLLLLAFFLILADYRIMKLFMAGVPFNAERVWIVRDFISAPFLAILGYTILQRLSRSSRNASMGRFVLSRNLSSKMNARAIITYVFVITVVSGWITASLYFAYPSVAPMQTTSYEIDAVKFLDANTTEKYVVIADQWIIYAGEMFVGVYNPRAYYFGDKDPTGIRIFLDMKYNASSDAMIKAMKYNNATVAYFIIDKPRMDAETYDRIIQQATVNRLLTYRIFYYRNEEKLRIFYYRNP